jgi:hypothetical protein
VRKRGLIAFVSGCVSYCTTFTIASHLQQGGAGVAPAVPVCISIGQQGIFKNSENGEPLAMVNKPTLKNLQMGATVLSKW